MLEWFSSQAVPALAGFEWDFAPIRRRILRWVKRMAQGNDNRCQIFTMARFIEGGIIGPGRERVI